MTAYYNEIDPFAAQWLRNLINAGHIAPGIVDERSIEDVYPSDLRGFTQCHFFAGIGVWSHALLSRRMAAAAVVEIIPEKNVCTLDYSAIATQIIYPLIEALNVPAVFADRWNSLKLLHDIEAKYGIVAEQYSIK